MGQINYMTGNIYNGDFNIYSDLEKILPHIEKYYREFIELIPQLNNIGMEIDMKTLVNQIKTLSAALEKRDSIIIFDTLRYEVKDTLRLYDEIKEIMEQG